MFDRKKLKFQFHQMRIHHRRICKFMYVIKIPVKNDYLFNFYRFPSYIRQSIGTVRHPKLIDILSKSPIPERLELLSSSLLFSLNAFRDKFQE